MNRYCIIMAGGVGTRFWPLSRQNKPKQFLDIMGTGKSFLRHTFERFAPLVPDENFIVVTNRRYKELIEKGEQVTYEEVEANVRKRDYIDEHRKTSPLVRTSDAVLIDNGDMAVEEEGEEMLKIIRSKYESRN